MGGVQTQVTRLKRNTRLHQNTRNTTQGRKGTWDTPTTLACLPPVGTRCKTRGDPYDVVVKGVLILAAVHLGAAVFCDLDPEYAVHTWDASLALLHDAGLCLDVPTVAPFLDYS